MYQQISAAFIALLGAEHVLVQRADLDAYQTATFACAQTVVCVARPGTREEVQACLRLAGALRVAVYPVSRGRNTAYGSAVPASDGCVVLDLSRMDRVLAFDEQLGYVVVEPGVTFRQLFRFLAERGSGLFPSVTGGPAEGSVVGNIAERGLGSGLYADRAEHCCGLEVVLADGSVVHTGFGRWPDARATPVHRAGVGPALDGLFLQSNLGVITQLSLWLMPLPEELHTFTFSLRASGLAAAIDVLQGLLFRRLRATYVFLWNDYKQLSGRMRYPYDQAAGAEPLPDPLRLALRAGLDWAGMGAIYGGSAAQARAERAQVEAQLVGVVDGLSFTERGPAEIRALLQGMVQDLALPRPGAASGSVVDGILLGVPTDSNLATCYWRKAALPEGRLAPEADRCGTYAATITVPFRGADVAEAIGVIEAVVRQGGYEPQLSLSRLKERTLDMIVFLAFDRERAGEDERARTTYRALLGALGRRGFYPCRLSLHSMNELPPASDDSDAVLLRLRAALDPARTLAPGRYLP